MIEVKQFDPYFATRLPVTSSILESANLVVHPLVTQITLHGSRGLAQNYRPNSDIDLSLLVPFPTPPVIGEELGKCLQEVISVTLPNWRGPVEADLAVIFPMYSCSFACFQRATYRLCVMHGRWDRLFRYLQNPERFPGIRAECGNPGSTRMYPCITVWKK